MIFAQRSNASRGPYCRDRATDLSKRKCPSVSQKAIASLARATPGFSESHLNPLHRVPRSDSFSTGMILTKREKENGNLEPTKTLG